MFVSNIDDIDGWWSQPLLYQTDFVKWCYSFRKLIVDTCLGCFFPIEDPQTFLESLSWGLGLTGLKSLFCGRILSDFPCEVVDKILAIYNGFLLHHLEKAERPPLRRS